MAPFLWQSRIRFSDTDASGRIHYTALFRHFEAAEFEFMRSIGVPYMIALREESYPRVHVECDYLAALECDDVIETAVTVERIGRTSYTLAFVATKDGAVAGKGKIAVVCMDRGTKRPKPLPPQLNKALQESGANV